MLNTNPTAGAGTRPSSHRATVPPKGSLSTRATREVLGEVAPLEDASVVETLHPSSRRSKQVTCPVENAQGGSLMRAGLPAIHHAPRVPTPWHSGHLARSDSRRAKDTAIALAWLRDGAPVEDAVTVIEIRCRVELSPDFARRYATNIVKAAGKIVRAERSNSSREEIIHAAA